MTKKQILLEHFNQTIEETNHLPDIQKQQENFLYPISHVGIKNFKMPITLYENGENQHSIADIQLTVSLNQYERGTHMSRFVEILQDSLQHTVSFNHLKEIVTKVKQRLQADTASIKMTFPWYFYGVSPISQNDNLQYGEVSIESTIDSKEKMMNFVSLTCFATTLCPCSKEISKYGAHNQRGKITISGNISTESIPNDWKLQLKDIAINNASAPIHSLLKRQDEKYVTEQAYENPRFVEDLARLIAVDLADVKWLDHKQVICENEESIHAHNAIAQIHL